MVVVKQINEPAEISDICALLYQTHIKDAQWVFEKNNPSELRVELKNGQKILVDRFTNQAIWFAAFDEEKMVGCVRLTFVDENNRFEVEAYEPSHVIREYLDTDRSSCVEISRAGVISNYNGLGVFKQLLLVVLEYCQEHGYSIFGTSRHGYLLALFRKIEFPLRMEYAFKYEPHDPMAVNFYFADFKKAEIKNMIKRMSERSKPKILDALEIVAPVLPALVYWHNADGVVLGLNGMCLEGMGVFKVSDVIGKLPYDFYPAETAAHILNHNQRVISTGEMLSQDEPINDITTGRPRVFRSTKAPLYDDEGKVIGIVGCSIEVTAEKEAERLKIENEKQRAQLLEEEKFRKLAHQVVHDIRSPLASMQMLVKSCSQIPEEYRIALRQVAINIGDIADNLLNQYRKEEYSTAVTEKSPVLVSVVLSEALTAKKYQYQNLNINFQLDFDNNTHFLFINIAPSDFRRALSNLINNAVDALTAASGVIRIRLALDEGNVKISISDTGVGMSEDLISKVMNKVPFTTGKKEGYGIGMTQVWDTLDKSHGQLDIESKIGQGTTVRMTFPRIGAPSWIAEEIEVGEKDIIVILDDDTSIYQAWKTQFKASFHDELNSRQIYFSDAKEALAFLRGLSPFEKNRVFLLTDYELLQDELNGLHVISKSGIKRSLLVTSHYADLGLQAQASELGTKILPKQLASEVQILLPKKIVQQHENNIRKKVDAIFIDDNKTFLRMITLCLKDNSIDTYKNPEEFLSHLDEYPKDTKIFLDHHYNNSWLKGLNIAEILYKKGYKKLHLLSGEDFLENQASPYLSILPKDCIEKIKAYLNDE